MTFDNFNTETDWEFFELSEKEAYKATNDGMEIPGELLESRRKEVESFLIKDNFHVKILREDIKPVGIIIAGTHRNPDSTMGFLYNIYIEPPFRKKGFGKLAMENVINFSKNRGCSKIALNVGADNTTALTLYQSLGFQTRSLSMVLDLPVNQTV